MSAAADVRRRSDHPARLRALLIVAGVTYVLVWVVGLVVAPSAPPSTASAGTVHAFYVQHAGAVLLQSLLIHGVAGLALLLIAILIARLTSATGTLRRSVIWSGCAAAAVSFLQVGLEVAATARPAGQTASTSLALFHSINYADSLKLLLLALFAATVTLATRRAGMAPVWLRILGYILMPLLVAGAAAFIVDNAILTLLLAISLIVLLLWVGCVSVVVARRSR